MAKKNRIAVSPSQQPLQNTPFAELDLGPLPCGPESGTSSQDQSSIIPPQTTFKGRIVLRREKKHRGGKTVIVVIFDQHISGEAIAAFAQSLKQQLGCGGTVQDHMITIQGDQQTKLRSFFENQGFHVVGP